MSIQSALPASLAAFLALSSVDAGAVTYTVTEIPRYQDRYTYAWDVNDSGKVAGYVLGQASQNVYYNLPLSWTQAGGVSGMPTLGATIAGTGGAGTGGKAEAVNNSGVMAGYSFTGVGNTFHATKWDANGNAVDLGTLGGSFSEAFDINNAGQVVGYSYNTGNTQMRPVVWSANGSPTDLGSLAGGPGGKALAINDLGEAVGYAFKPYDQWGSVYDRAVVWRNGTVTELGTLGGNESFAYDINNLGQVVGTSQAGSRVGAFIWENGVMTEIIGVGPSIHGSLAYGINDHGQVVGESGMGGVGDTSHAFIWQNGVTVDLNNVSITTVANGQWVLRHAYEINNKGQIVGLGTLNGVQTAFLLTPDVAPVPEPETYALMLAGLGLLGWKLRSRRA